jgi:hypothetical protein
LPRSISKLGQENVPGYIAYAIEYVDDDDLSGGPKWLKRRPTTSRSGTGSARMRARSRYKFAMKGLTHGEALELMCIVRRLELYRVAMIDTDIVESSMRTMANAELINAKR